MPARSLARDSNGLSAVIGVFLIVIIMVVLATTVWVLIQQSGTKDHIRDRPEFSLIIDANEPQATVAKADDGLDWVRDLRLSGSCEPTLNGDPFPTFEGQRVQANDVLACEAGETLVISSSPDLGNTVLFRHTF